MLVSSKHTTCAVTVNEFEPRLMDDVSQFFHKLCPAAAPYLHNDLHKREAPEVDAGNTLNYKLSLS